MKQNKKLLLLASSFMAVGAITFVSPSCANNSVEYKVDISCQHCSINGKTQYTANYKANEEVKLSFRADESYNLANDVVAIRNNKILVKDMDYSYSRETGELKFNIKGDTNIVVTANAGSLDNYTWDQIKDISTQGKANEYFKVGDTKDVKVNGSIHKVKIIGFNQDVDANNKKIGITFEFENLISDEYGYSLATYWQDTDKVAFANFDYMNSTIRASLNGEGHAKAEWFQYFYLDDESSKHFSSEYENKSVLSMLPNELTSVLTAPKKYINVYNDDKKEFEEITVNDKLFLLSPKEMGCGDASQEKNTSAYILYEGHSEYTDSIRIKHQVSWHSYSRSEPLGDYDLDGAFRSEREKKYTYAGYNDDVRNNGGDYWLRSPNPNKYDGRNAWSVYSNGKTNYQDQIYTYSYAKGIAPAFCI